MGQGREAASGGSIPPAAPPHTPCLTLTLGLADGPDLHPLQFQFGALLGCLRRLQTTRNREEFSTTGLEWSVVLWL